MLGADAGQAGVDIVQNGTVSQLQEAEFILAGDGAVEGGQVHVGGGGAAGTAGTGGGTAAAAAAVGLGIRLGVGLLLRLGVGLLLRLGLFLPVAGDGAGGLGAVVFHGDGGLAGGHGLDIAALVDGGHLGIAGGKGGDAVGVGLGGVAQLEGGPGLGQLDLRLVQSDGNGGKGLEVSIAARAAGVGAIRLGAVGLRAVGGGTVRLAGAAAGGDDAHVGAVPRVGGGTAAAVSAAAGGQGQGHSGGQHRRKDTSFHNK